ncbi:MAG: DUF3800 domain-containing protein [Planctomycetes bacterium]|nr:DUF3800 domain-containing protein [Planctomycetota bacterium]
MPTKKLICYVDETGQDTLGRLFIVSVVVTADRRDELLQLWEQHERASGKGNVKWRAARHSRRVDYLQRVVTEVRFAGALRYAVFRRVTDYDLATVTGIAQALRWHSPAGGYKAVVYVDGLPKTQRTAYGNRLRHLGIPTRKVQGVTRDENNALLRLADAVAGLVRDVMDGTHAYAQPLLDLGKQQGTIVEV